MNTIVLATDGSPSAEGATQLAIELARDTGARLCVSAAWHAPQAVYSFAPMTAVPEIERADKERAYSAARAAVKLAEAEGIEAESFVREGDPVAIVAQTAADSGASLVVAGSHGWGAVRRLVFGSVSTGLLHHSPCPVLIVRPALDASRLEAKEKAVA